MPFAFCSPHYEALGDDTEPRCFNFKTPAEKQAERQMEPTEISHFRSMQLPKKIQLISGMALLLYGLLLVFSPEYMAYHLFMGKEYMKDQGFATSDLQTAQEIEARNRLEYLQLQEKAIIEENDAFDERVVNMAETILNSGVNTAKQQMLAASQAVREAELQLAHMEQLRTQTQKEMRARGEASIPFQQFSRFYGSLIIAVALHAISTVSLDYHVNCNMALFYISFYSTQAVAMLLAIMPIVKVENTITTVISSSLLLKALLIVTALMCAVWVWVYQKLKVASPHVKSILQTLEEGSGGASDDI